MNSIEQIVENARLYGKANLQILFDLHDNQMKEVLKGISAIMKNSRAESLINSGQIRRTILNEEVESISIEYYDSISINMLGIYFNPEHGPSVQMVEFNKNFKL